MNESHFKVRQGQFKNKRIKKYMPYKNIQKEAIMIILISDKVCFKKMLAVIEQDIS